MGRRPDDGQPRPFVEKGRLCDPKACWHSRTINFAYQQDLQECGSRPLDNERFDQRTTTISPEATLDIKAGGFWSRGVTAFFDVRGVTYVNSRSNQDKPTAMIFKEQENEKKRKYQQRVLDVEMGSFTPLVFGTNGGMGVKCQMFFRHRREAVTEGRRALCCSDHMASTRSWRWPRV